MVHYSNVGSWLNGDRFCCLVCILCFIWFWDWSPRWLPPFLCLCGSTEMTSRGWNPSHTARSTVPSAPPIRRSVRRCILLVLPNTSQPYVLKGTRVSRPCFGGPRYNPFWMGWSGETWTIVTSASPPGFRLYLFLRLLGLSSSLLWQNLECVGPSVVIPWLRPVGLRIVFSLLFT